ncbi:HDOD domain-containing protein [Candidatus Latescibacterota bacterium]
MNIFTKIRRHAAIASGNFASMFKGAEIPAPPAAVARLVAEINRPEPDMDQLVKLVSSSPGLAAKVIKTVNSSLFAVRAPVTNVKHATTLLGLKNMRSIALAYATIGLLPKPKATIYKGEAFWTDSLLRAMLARSLAKKSHPDELEDAFTAGLLADVAVPVLLSAWSSYYRPIVREWKRKNTRLSKIERQHFGWDHAQAGAFILQSWDFPEDMVAYTSAHNLTWKRICKLDLADTIVAPIAVASYLPSVLKPSRKRFARVYSSATEWLSLTHDEFVACADEVRHSFTEFLEFFDMDEESAQGVIHHLATAADTEPAKG